MLYDLAWRIYDTEQGPLGPIRVLRSRLFSLAILRKMLRRLGGKGVTTLNGAVISDATLPFIRARCAV